MREILFRGKRVDNGEWVYGYLLKMLGELSIMRFDDENNIYPVDEQSVGQYTGLTDKKGTKIFDGDIVCTRYRTGEICCSGDVQFSHGVYGAEWLGNKKNKSMVGGWGQLHNLRRFDDDIINDIEVIGNIYDNPELLEYDT